ncbi:MAG TPA: threonine ammonia-lyase [Blastocatellia bacterium]|nr:threonine ammonia-lyase [Blastocatellia bacterium]HMV83024.1 threonine ammonia-lyase [Blastocatellia bacterium]HMX26637.1 threonine ammonia-lyase [Blastocatellia bacterium]HMY72151.1 threonine ammonia-lyase [Blastocatellia bacterium]HMZ18952.1 threonine ammonia-lyase [Blastocatellia bacterium]
MVTLSEVQAARVRLGRAVYRTPCPLSHTLSRICGCRTYFKLENLQMTGSFKERGALNKLAQLSPAEREAGVVAASAGNHAQGVAHHATRLGIHSVIVMPKATPLVKVSNTRDLGGEVILHGANYDEALAHAKQLAAEHGYTFVHAFDDEAIIAGQGTIGLELLEEETKFDAVVVPIGGGGMISGVAIALKESQPGIRVIGVEPENFASMKAAVEEGRTVEIPAHPTIADGLAVKRAGERTSEIVRRYVDEIVTVSEDEMASAILKLLEIEKTVVEGGGAASLAALLFGKIKGVAGLNVAMVVSGGNIDPNLLSKIIERGLAKDGRMVRIRAMMRDRPGELARICQHVAELGANILEVEHNRAFSNLEVGGVEIDLTLEARGHDHVNQLLKGLHEDGIEAQRLN